MIFRVVIDGLKRIFRKTKEVQTYIQEEKQAFPYRAAILYRDKVKEAIITQKYAGHYKAYSRRYAAWKSGGIVTKEGKRIGWPGGNKGFWRLGDDLLNNIMVKKEGDGYFSGVPNGIYDKGGKSWFGSGDKGKSKEIAMYGSIAEEIRPLFGPVAEEMQKKEMPELMKHTENAIGTIWSGK